MACIPDFLSNQYISVYPSYHSEMCIRDRDRRFITTLPILSSSNDIFSDSMAEKNVRCTCFFSDSIRKEAQMLRPYATISVSYTHLIHIRCINTPEIRILQFYFLLHFCRSDRHQLSFRHSLTHHMNCLLYTSQSRSMEAPPRTRIPRKLPAVQLSGRAGSRWIKPS